MMGTDVVRKAGVAVLGYGTVGSGVAEILTSDSADFVRKAGCELELKYILDIRDFSGDALADRFVKDLDSILADGDVSVVVEAIGGLSPALEYNTRCLKAKKSVVTSNKELVATHGSELLKLAHDNGVSFLFEAAVGGAAPIIGTMLGALAASPISEIAGILNGTTNFILTQMKQQGLGFGEALAIAQQKGYAETIDPSDDVDGIDPKRKIAILASIAFGTHVPPEKVEAVGIRNVGKNDLDAAASKDGTIKLIAHAKQFGDGAIDIGVEPMFVARSSRFYTVDDVYNACWFSCRYARDIVVFGPGAGKLETGGAIIGDIAMAVRNAGAKPVLWAPYTDGAFAFRQSELREYLVIDSDSTWLSDAITAQQRDALVETGARCYAVFKDETQEKDA